MNPVFTSHVCHNQKAFRHSTLAGFAALGLVGFCSAADAADKPPLAPDTVAPFSTNSRLSASIEFSLPALAADIGRDIPQRLASIDERISCVHRRVLFWKSTPIATCGAMSSGPDRSRSMAAATASMARCRSMALLRGRAPTGLPRASMVKPKQAPRSKLPPVRNSDGTGRSTSISATDSGGANRQFCG